jgi:hypothetical protein
VTAFAPKRVVSIFLEGYVAREDARFPLESLHDLETILPLERPSSCCRLCHDEGSRRGQRMFGDPPRQARVAENMPSIQIGSRSASDLAFVIRVLRYTRA